MCSIESRLEPRKGDRRQGTQGEGYCSGPYGAYISVPGSRGKRARRAGRWLGLQDSTRVGDGEGSSHDETRFLLRVEALGLEQIGAAGCLRRGICGVSRAITSRLLELRSEGVFAWVCSGARLLQKEHCGYGEGVLGTQGLPNHPLPGSGVLRAEVKFIF